MALDQLYSCSLILREHFGEVVESVGTYLAKKGPMPLGSIAKDTGLKIEQVGVDLKPVSGSRLTQCFLIEDRCVDLYSSCWISRQKT